MNGTPQSKYIEQLPDNYEWFEEQIAGHHPSVYKGGKREIGRGFFRPANPHLINLPPLHFVKTIGSGSESSDSDPVDTGILKKQGSDKILKVVQDGKRGICEIAFYRLIKGDQEGDCADEETDPKKIWPKTSDEDCRLLAPFIPEYYGRQMLLVDGEEHEFLCFDDLTIGYKRPAILDIKMGKHTFDPDASASKREKESAKYPPQENLGFRILGYRIHRQHEVTVRGKNWGRDYDESNVANAMREFFHGGRENSQEEIQKSVVEQLQDILFLFETQTSLHFYASSLFFIYEADPDLPVNLNIRMIDFSHVFPGSGQLDENYLPGVRTLLRLMTEIA